MCYFKGIFNVCFSVVVHFIGSLEVSMATKATYTYIISDHHCHLMTVTVVHERVGCRFEKTSWGNQSFSIIARTRANVFTIDTLDFCPAWWLVRKPCLYRADDKTWEMWILCSRDEMLNLGFLENFCAENQRTFWDGNSKVGGHRAVWPRRDGGHFGRMIWVDLTMIYPKNSDFGFRCWGEGQFQHETWMWTHLKWFILK